MREIRVFGFPLYYYFCPGFFVYWARNFVESITTADSRAGLWKQIPRNPKRNLDEKFFSIAQNYYSRYRRIRPHLKEKMSVLDVGCGEGHMLRLLSMVDPSLELCGMDLHETCRPLIEKYVPRARFVQADALAGLPFDDRSFDFVICVAFMPIFSAEERGRIAAELARVSKKHVYHVESTVRMRLNNPYADIAADYRRLGCNIVFDGYDPEFPPSASPFQTRAWPSMRVTLIEVRP